MAKLRYSTYCCHLIMLLFITPDMHVLIEVLLLACVWVFYSASVWYSCFPTGHWLLQVTFEGLSTSIQRRPSSATGCVVQHLTIISAWCLWP